MSSHPLGPWSETLISGTIPVSGGILRSRQLYDSVYLNNIEYPYTGGNIPISDIRTGYNSGGASPTPRSASRSLTEFKVGTPATAFVKYYDQNIAQKRNTREYTMRQFGVPSLFVAKYTKQNLTDKAFAAFIEKSNDSQFTGLAFAGEFKSFRNDVRFLTNVILGRHNEAYKQLVKNLVRFKKGSAKDVLQAAADHWLQVRFGLAPDVHDLTALVKQFNNVAKHTELAHKVTGRFTDFSVDSQVTIGADQWNVFNQRRTRQAHFVYVGKVGASLKTSFVSTTPSLSQRFGVGFEDVVPALYELFPFSWLVDYFTNLGDFVSLLALRRGRYTDGWKLSIIEQNVSLSIEPMSQRVTTSDLVLSYSGNPGVSSIRTFAFNRDPTNVDTYIPEFRFESPSMLQTANIAAVAVSLLNKRRLSYDMLTRG